MTDSNEKTTFEPQEIKGVDTSPPMYCSVLLGAGMVMVVMPSHMPAGMAFGLLLSIWAVVWAYRIRRTPSAGDLLQSHGRWLVRTFWIGGLYAFLLYLAGVFAISSLADMSAFETLEPAMKAGAIKPNDVIAAVESYTASNHGLFTRLAYMRFVPVAVFVVVRMFKSYRAADRGEAPARVTSWLF